ncbi:Tyrosinase_Cu-bd domain-containing protein [Meloidogyne graminicola]|uniref:Tyrosinase_Cu-bd domain-containing protein n=1 Tax=Meloidogyne graminicola TaxID=189291 RepID=A0A8S9ZPF2_9BILA|nr:Tyrosinase_Cu-bd domain-containing protein [Meloidogyne graminicola]
MVQLMIVHFQMDKKLKKAIRKELRMLTDEERNEIFAAIREMKNNGDYDYIASVHRDAVYSGCAHGGQAFFLFHREYTKRFEILLRKRNPTLFLPYWDSTLESRLPNPEDSILFTDLFMGTTNSNGYGNPYISRNLGQEGRCFNEDDINWILAQTQIENILSYTLLDKGCPYKQNWRWCEFIHGKSHRWIGGDMAYIEQSANDPLFMKFHCFVDYLLEIWRQKQQNREQRVTEYPKDLSECTPVCHFKNATMSQFAPLKNADGLRNEYTDNLYEYAPRPTCTNSDVECGSKYLFCDLSHDSPHCAAKVKPGGNCKGFNKGEQVCFNSTCQSDGICVFEMQNIETTSIKIQNQKEITTLNAKTSLENETTSKQFNKQLNLEKETIFEYTTKITKKNKH